MIALSISITNSNVTNEIGERWQAISENSINLYPDRQAGLAFARPESNSTEGSVELVGER